MTLQKRIFDIAFALTIGLPVLLAVAVISLVIVIRGEGPVFYISRRMKTLNKEFLLIKIRTMASTKEGDSGVTGADKAERITPTGALLRRYRLDELPQIWNVLRGDISVVGPRPPLREYVTRFPEVYEKVLKSRPGLTGLATLKYHRHEAALLAQTSSAGETDRIYVTRCIPAKARLDLIYQKHSSICFDAVILLTTVKKIWARSG